MPPPLKPWTEKLREEQGFSSIKSFFSPPPKPGRPLGSGRSKPGPPPATASQPAAPQVPARAAAPPPPPVAAGGGKRTNYSSGNGLLRMTAAVENWLGKKGDVYTPGMEMKRYCELVEIPVETLRKYVVPDTLKRRKPGRSGVGGSGQGLLDEDTAQFLVDTMRRRDRGDDGMGRKESIDMLQDLRPELSRRQVSNQFDRTIRPKYSDVLTGIVKAEATTSKRSQITVAQQYRWHTVCMPHPRAFLRPYYGNTRRHPAYCVLYDIDYYTCFYLYYVLSHPVERVVAMCTVRENGVPNAVAPPKVSQRRAQPCAAVRRRIDTASSSAMIVLMCSLALCDQAQRMTARRKRFQVAQNQTWGCLDRRRCRDDVRERL